MAEGEGFEPPLPFRVKRFSRPPVSTAHTSLRESSNASNHTTLASHPSCNLLWIGPRPFGAIKIASRHSYPDAIYHKNERGAGVEPILFLLGLPMGRGSTHTSFVRRV